MTDHIKITPARGIWVVRAGGAVLGETSHALTLTEGDHPPVIYFPRADIAMAFLEAASQTSTCPWKGAANYYSIQTKSTLISNAAWSYENPKPEVSDIAGYLAFYPEKATVEQV